MVGYQLDDEPNLEMVGNHHFHPFYIGCLGFQVDVCVFFWFFLVTTSRGVFFWTIRYNSMYKVEVYNWNNMTYFWKRNDLLTQGWSMDDTQQHRFAMVAVLRLIQEQCWWVDFDPKKTTLNRANRDQFGLLFSSTKGRLAIFFNVRYKMSTFFCKTGRPDISTNTTCPGDLRVCHLGDLWSLSDLALRPSAEAIRGHFEATTSKLISHRQAFFDIFSTLPIHLFFGKNEGNQKGSNRKKRRGIYF